MARDPSGSRVKFWSAHMGEEEEQKRSNDGYFSTVGRYNLLLRGPRKFARETVRIGNERCRLGAARGIEQE